MKVKAGDWVLNKYLVLPKDGFLPDAEVKSRLDRGDWLRADGDCKCAVCGKAYYLHIHHPTYDWIIQLCDNTLIKL